MGQLTFPLNLMNRAFRVATILVVNNTAAMLFLATTGNPGVGNTPVPPYTALPLYGWDSTDVAIGSDGATLRDSDTLSLTYFDDRPALPSIQLNQPNYYNQTGLVYATYGTGGGRIVTTPATQTYATYTVPANRKASVEEIGLSLVNTAAGGADADGLLVSVQAPGYLAETLAAVQLYSNILGGSQTVAVSQCGVIGAGSIVQLNLFSNSAGATYRLRGGFRITEFDA